ncbi:glycosyltransferase family 39 protein [Cylindrospermum sp. FACHB-282]|uniref:glycosyltransferase family 39 protein n=1 Tax=Cylindrospermum sp. FACHB-282 TaxID=2692794 RepID=UPI0016870E6E|nr:glycosyltransferase family 39 protein [Cylindrospermum sp. FACHB-282]MBD2386817.1 glycosyltransferase family 39 protein [Cylindrospermum sp. FACHB-282]
MRISFSLSSDKHSRILRFILVIVLVLGVSFRFINIDKKAYWDDEAFTSLRISGYTEAELVERVASVDRISVKDLDKYQNINLNKGLNDTINSLALEDPQHPPAYYVITWFWVQWFGNSVAAFRSLSALLSLLALPCIYWLCRELFDSSLTAWIAVALIGISPFHVLYAQEAREYSLWTVTILLSSASLLHAIRLNTKLKWGIYAATVALSLYTFPSSAIVTVAHGIYVITIEGFRFSKRMINYLLASIAGFTVFSPWLVVIITNLNHINKTVGGQGNMPTLSLIKIWTFNLSRIFIDTNNERAVIDFGFENPLTYIIQITLVALLVILSGYSLYFLCRKTYIQAWLFILTLILVTCLPIMLKDLIDGGARTIILRYLTPGYLGIQISIAYLLATGITTISRQQKLWQIILCLLFSGAVYSGVISSQANYWWTKSHSDVNFYAAEFINRANRPLLISDGSMGMILGLSHQINSHVQLQLKPYCHTCRVISPAVLKKNLLPIPDGFDLFLVAPSHGLIKEIEKDAKYKIKPVSVELWQLVPQGVIKNKK